MSRSRTAKRNRPPAAVAQSLEEQRRRAARFIEERYRSLADAGVDCGPALAPMRYRGAVDAWTHRYRHALFMYHDGIGRAFVLTSDHLRAYLAMTARASLGHLVSDEGEAESPGGRKTLFTAGGIYSCASTAPVAVLGMVYLAYEAVGESRALGFPTAPQGDVPGGVEQRFEEGRILYRSGAGWAHYLRGPALEAYLAAGGVAALGFPLTDAVSNRPVELEGGSIYIHKGVGVVVAGDFRREYQRHGGPDGELGLPVEVERDIPHHPGPGRYQRFEHGTLLAAGPGPMLLVRQFRLFIGRVNTQESDPWPGQGANDIYLRVRVRQNSRELYSARLPGENQDWSTGNNAVDVNTPIAVTIDPVPGDTVTLEVTVFDSDTGTDDRLGRWTHILTAADGWGLGTDDGVFRSGAFGKVNSITAAHQPVVDTAALTDVQMFWGVDNEPTPRLTWSQYAEAFSDVDNDRDWWDPTDWLDRAFYELAVENIAQGGNCVGMSLEAVYSRKGMSVFGQPLDRFTTWSTIRREINIRQAYQVGASAVYWFLGQFVSGRTHNPVGVFDRSQGEFAAGSQPVLCLTQNYDFSGKPHCVLPVAWDKSVVPWRITVSDPNDPQNLRTLTVNPKNNAFVYQGPHNRYAGGDWTGGRLLYLPFGTVGSRPRTPVWEAVVLLMSSMTLFVAGAATTSGLTDAAGNDLDATGRRALADLQAGRRIDDYFVPVPRFDADQNAGALYCRSHRLEHVRSTERDGMVSRRSSRFAAVRGAGGSFRHSLRGTGNGAVQYVVKHGLSQYRLSTSTGPKQDMEVAVDGLGTHRVGLGMSVDRDRVVRLDLEHRLGVRGDRVGVTVSGLTATPEQALLTSLGTGFGGLDLVPATPTTAAVAVEYSTEGETRKKSMRLVVKRGVRLDLARLQETGTVEVTPIERVGGPAAGLTRRR
ncbi:LGFP repeat-containing protein [Amycolatopsis sp. NBC_00438]|uniref:LGFP repeat-containing protein n=1 Tax=Amycolatopsis sp. NBC_00438 TaxID=2903558 RepID=UPI002E1E210D